MPETAHTIRFLEGPLDGTEYHYPHGELTGKLPCSGPWGCEDGGQYELVEVQIGRITSFDYRWQPR